MRTRRTVHGLALTIVLVLLSSSCGDERGVGGDTDVREPSESSSPFAVSALPDGYESVLAGTGTDVQAWGSDGAGTHEPFTVLVQDDSTAPEDVVVVSITGFEGYQGGLAQASAGYLDSRRSSRSVGARHCSRRREATRGPIW